MKTLSPVVQTVERPGISAQDLLKKEIVESYYCQYRIKPHVFNLIQMSIKKRKPWSIWELRYHLTEIQYSKRIPTPLWYETYFYYFTVSVLFGSKNNLCSQTNWDCLKTLRYQYIQDIKGKYLKNKWFGLTNHLDKESPLPFGSCNLVVVVEPSKQYRNPLTSFSYSLLIPLPTFQPWVGSLPCAEKISTKGPPCNTIPHSIIKLSRQSTFIRKSNNVHVHVR